MATTATRKIVITYLGDVIYSQAYAAAENIASPGDIDILNLASGANTITVPAGGSTVKGATIIPPAANTNTITLKGVTGDTGIALSKLDPTSIAFETAPATFVLTAGGVVTGLRIIWT